MVICVSLGFIGALGVMRISMRYPETASSKNIIYRNIIQACGGYGSNEKSADVIVDACEAKNLSFTQRILVSKE